MLRAPHQRLCRRCAGGFPPDAGRTRAPYRCSAAGLPADAGSVSLTDRDADFGAADFDARAHGDADLNADTQPDGYGDPEGSFGSSHRVCDAHARPDA